MCLCALVVGLSSCRKDPEPPEIGPENYYIVVPQGFPTVESPTNNALTVEGIELGRHLFYEEKLSGDNTQACASCHFQSKAFSDTVDFSLGIQGNPGLRNAMPIFNLAWSPTLFWDGRAESLEEQALFPVQDHLEMDETWDNVVAKLQNTTKYPPMFEAAFGSPGIDSVRASKALAQFMRTLISGNSPFDQFANNGYFDRSYLHPNPTIANYIYEGWQIFNRDYAGPGIDAGSCFHCHTDPAATRLTTDFQITNNGLDDVSADLGLGGVAGFDPVQDRGKFKTPSLRNLSYTAPYMHDGRFNTLEEVIDFYADSVQAPANLDLDLYHGSINDKRGAVLSPIARYKIKLFLESLNDPSFVNNPAFSDPG